MKKSVAACAAVLAIAASAPAHAAKFLITYTGTVGLGTSDGFGLFGSAGDLYKKAFTATYTLDTSVPGFETGSASNQYLYGGTSLGYGNPLSATLTIAGVSLNFGSPSTHLSTVNQVNAGSDQVYHQINDVNSISGGVRTYVSIYNTISGSQIVSTADYTAPLNYTVQPGDSAIGWFDWAEMNASNNQIIRATRVRLVASSVSIAELTAAVPEPGTWGLMITGFGAVGTMMRRRRAAAAAIA